MYQLFARMYGSNNLPDSSNMCHESSSVALPESIGASVGTAILSDFENTDCIFYIAQNVGTSSPRLLHDLQDAVDRGVKIVTFNLLRERGLERFVNPQSPVQMLTGKETPISSEYYQVNNGGDIAALFGVCKALIEADDALKASGQSRVAGRRRDAEGSGQRGDGRLCGIDGLRRQEACARSRFHQGAHGRLRGIRSSRARPPMGRAGARLGPEPRRR